jgi:hypothetical protein
VIVGEDGEDGEGPSVRDLLCEGEAEEDVTAAVVAEARLAANAAAAAARP